MNILGQVKHLLFLVIVIFGMSGLPLKAETLPITAIYPAASDDLSALNSLTFRPFSGPDGQALDFALEQELGSVYINGIPYFTIIDAGHGANVSGTVSGSAYGNSESHREMAKTQVCVARNTNGKCLQTQWVEIACTRRTITLNYTLAVSNNRGRRIYSKNDSAFEGALICRDTTDVPAVELVIQGLIKGVAAQLRTQFAPTQTQESIRVKEGVNGLKGNAKQEFKQGIKLTKRNVSSACEVWNEVDQLVPNHTSILFNLGLCAESRGDFGEAQSLYQRVAALDRSETYATDGLNRLAQRQHAERQLAIHARVMK